MAEPTKKPIEDDDDKDPGVTRENLAELVGPIVAATVKDHLGRSLKKELDPIKEAVAAFSPDKLAEAIKKAVGEVQPPPVDDKSKADKKPDPEIAALKQKLDEITRSSAEKDAKLAAQQKATREKDARNALRAALKDVRPEMVDIAAEYLAKRLVLDEENEDGPPLFVVRRAPAPGMREEDVQMPLVDGVATFLKTKEGEVFLPAPNGQNRSDPKATPRRASRYDANSGLPTWDKPAQSDAEKAERAYQIEQAIQARVRQQT